MADQLKIINKAIYPLYAVRSRLKDGTSSTGIKCYRYAVYEKGFGHHSDPKRLSDYVHGIDQLWDLVTQEGWKK